MRFKGHVDMSQSIFGTWSDQDAQLWGHVPRHYNHNLHQHPLFSAESLGALIDRFPRSHYSLIQMGAQGGRRFWREGDLAGMKGQDVLKWIAAGRMWIGLRARRTRGWTRRGMRIRRSDAGFGCEVLGHGVGACAAIVIAARRCAPEDR